MAKKITCVRILVSYDSSIFLVSYHIIELRYLIYVKFAKKKIELL